LVAEPPAKLLFINKRFACERISGMPLAIHCPTFSNVRLNLKREEGKGVRKLHGVHSGSSRSGISLSASTDKSANAPTTPGTYTCMASWYGNQYDKAGAAFGNWVPDPSNPNHGEERVSTNSFDVIGGPPPVPDITVTDSVAPATDLRVPFGDVLARNSAGQTITITNDGGADLVLGPMARPSSPFSITAGNCSGMFYLDTGPVVSGARDMPQRLRSVPSQPITGRWSSATQMAPCRKAT
jgi:antitoxin (DNA-binding transcriptional repressor) of toxin-antitoxin stability system